MVSVLGQLKGGIDEIFDWLTKSFIGKNADKFHLIERSKLLCKSRCQISQ